MATQLQTASIAAPGFFGLNTQDSGVSLENGFALLAENTIIDKYGRLGSRRGWSYRTSELEGVADDNENLNLLGAHSALDLAGTKTYISWTATRFYTGYSDLERITPSTTDTLTAGNWTSASLNDRTYFFQGGYLPLVYTRESGSAVMKSVTTHTGSTGTPPSANIVISAYGRLWAADIATNKTVVYFSDLLDGNKWSGGSSGSLNISGSFAKNSDVITGLAAHNGFLIIFCRNQIMIYKDSDAFVGSFDTASLSLVETLDGVGCLSHHTIQNVGNDVLFLSATGIRSLGRTIQEKSQPIGNISKNIRDDLMELVDNETTLTDIKAIYCPAFAFYLVLFPSAKATYCFDTRAPLEDGAYRVTQWSNSTNTNFLYDSQERKLLYTETNGLAEYFGYQDNTEGFTYSYLSNYFDLGAVNNIKMVKRMSTTVIAPDNQVVVSKVGYDYSTNFYLSPFTIKGSSNPSYYNDSEYGTAEYSGGISIKKIVNNSSGSGVVLQTGFETTINGAPFSIQRLDVYIKLGKVI